MTHTLAPNAFKSFKNSREKIFIKIKWTRQQFRNSFHHRKYVQQVKNASNIPSTPCFVLFSPGYLGAELNRTKVLMTQGTTCNNKNDNN